MAEFCLDCWNKINETHDSKWRYSFSRGKDLCEECAQYKRVIVVERFWSRAQGYWQKQSKTFASKVKSKNPERFRIQDFYTGCVTEFGRKVSAIVELFSYLYRKA